MESIFEKVEGVGRTENERIEKALMIRADQERPFHRPEILHPLHFETQEHTKEKVEALINAKRERCEERSMFERLAKLGDVFVGGFNYDGPVKRRFWILDFGFWIGLPGIRGIYS